MSPVEALREFINVRLTAAAGEIFCEFQQTIIQYQEEIQTLHRLLEINLIPQTKPHTIDGPEQQINISWEHQESQAPQTKEEQQETEVLQFKEEQEELYSSQEEEQLVLKQEVDSFMMIPTAERSQPSEPEPDGELFLFQDSVGAESQHQERIQLEDSGSSRQAELKSNKRRHSKSAENSSFNPQNSLSVSTKTHKGEKQHACKTCGKGFSTPSKLSRHMQIHSGEKPHSCVICGKSFSHRDYLLVHIRIHSGEKPHSCVTCGKAFSQRSNMLLHMRTHTGEKPYSCVMCHKNFSQRSNMLVHMRAHTGEKW